MGIRAAMKKANMLLNDVKNTLTPVLARQYSTGSWDKKKYCGYDLTSIILLTISSKVFVGKTSRPLTLLAFQGEAKKKLSWLF